MIWILFVLCGMALCGNCSMYATKEACWESCACCWGGDDSYIVQYQCQWFCDSSDADYANPSTYCVAVNTVASFTIATGLLFGCLVALLLFVAALAAFIFGIGWIWDQIGDRVRQYVGRRFVIGVGVVAALAAASAAAAVAYPVAGVLLA